MKTLINTFTAQKWKLAYRVVRITLLVGILKFAVHYAGIEFLPLSSLFTAIISANIFLIGFLITGVLSDYKESEKLPGELAVSLEAITDELSIMYQSKKNKIIKQGIEHTYFLASSINDWFHKKVRTATVLEGIQGYNDYFLAFEPLTQANFIVRMKQEQTTLRRIITRIHSIRETSFNEAGYAIAEIISFLLIVGMIFLKLEPFYENVFFVIFVSFILIYMVMLIKDLDNPFGYYEEDSLSQEVSLKPLIDVQARIKGLSTKIK